MSTSARAMRWLSFRQLCEGAFSAGHPRRGRRSRRVRQSGRYRGCSCERVAADREGPARNAGRRCQQHPAWPTHHPPRPLRRGQGQDRPERGGEALERVGVERRPQGQVHLVGAGVDVLPDAVEHLLLGARQHARPHEVGQAAELLRGGSPPSRPGPTLTGDADLGRVAADVGAVGVEHAALVGERLGRDERDVPAVGPAAPRSAACAALPRRRPRSAARPAPGCGSQRASRELEPAARRSR